MTSISVQVQPDRAPGIDMARITEKFRSLVSRIDLVRGHFFDKGFDEGVYLNFTFETQRPAELWLLIQENILQAPDHAAHLAAASMAMCSLDDEWNDYVPLYHWDPSVPVRPVPSSDSD